MHTTMCKTALVAFLIHSTLSYPLTPRSFPSSPSRWSSYSGPGNPRSNPPFFGGHKSSATVTKSDLTQNTALVRPRRVRRLALLAATSGKDAQQASRPASGVVGRDPRRRASKALNRALGNVLAAGDIFGSVSKTVSDDNSFGSHFTSKLGQENNGFDDDDEDEDEEEEEEEEEEGDKERDAAQVERLLAGGNAPLLNRFGNRRRRRNTNRLLRASTEASAAVVVDGPFDKLEEYMTLPVSEYSLLDSSVIRRVSETSFRLQIPLKDFVGLDFTPTMEVEVDLDAQAKAVVFRSVRSTLYGNVGRPGEEANTYPWPEASSAKVEYFRVGFDARLRWADGDAALAPPPRMGKRAHQVEIARRPKPSPSQDTSPAVESGPGGKGEAERTIAAGELSMELPRYEELPEETEPATIFCDTDVKVQVLLPPPYNTLLPWRLVRALLGKVLSTTVTYMLPRFLELLAADFYSWQSGTRRAAAAAGEGDRTLLGAGGSRMGSNSGSGNRSAGAEYGGVVGRGGVDADEGEREVGGRGRSVRNTSGGRNRNPVLGGFQRLRNVRGPDGDWLRRGVATAAGETERDGFGDNVATSGSDSPSWPATSASTDGVSGDAFNFEVSLDVEEDRGFANEQQQAEADYEPRQPRWRRGWMGRGDRGEEGGGGGEGGSGGGGGGGGGVPINWWG